MLKQPNNSYNILIIIGLCIAIYSNSFYCEFQLDDRVHIATDNQIRNLNFYTNIDSWKNVNDRPLAFYTLALNKSIHGLDVVGYHIFNLIVHIISSIFIFLFSLLILQQLRIKRLTKNKGWIALFTALLFAAHPIQTQAVTYIIQRMTSMSAMFYIGATYFYLRGRSLHTVKKLNWNIIGLYCLTFFFAIASLLSKQIAVSLPFTLLAIEIFFVKDIEGNKVRKYIYTFSIALTLLTSIIIIAGYLPKETDTISRLDYFITQLRVIPKYFQLLLFPIVQIWIMTFPFPLHYGD